MTITFKDGFALSKQSRLEDWAQKICNALQSYSIVSSLTQDNLVDIIRSSARGAPLEGLLWHTLTVVGGSLLATIVVKVQLLPHSLDSTGCLIWFQ